MKKLLFILSLLFTFTSTSWCQLDEEYKIVENDTLTLEQYDVYLYFIDTSLTEILTPYPTSKCELEIHRKNKVRTRKDYGEVMPVYTAKGIKWKNKVLLKELEDENGKKWFKEFQKEIKECRESKKYEFKVKDLKP